MYKGPVVGKKAIGTRNRIVVFKGRQVTGVSFCAAKCSNWQSKDGTKCVDFAYRSQNPACTLYKTALFPDGIEDNAFYDFYYFAPSCAGGPP